MELLDGIRAAYQRIRPYVIETPLEYSPALSRETGAEVWLKLEHIQRTGSFKLRGAANKLLQLSRNDWDRGVVTASTGNHGAAVAYMAQQLKRQATVYLPENVAPAKVDFLKAYQPQLVFWGSDSVETERHAREEAEGRGQLFVSPYNDEDIVAGQGTLGVEIVSQLPEVESILVPVGGGGLISGVAAYAKGVQPRIQVTGCQPVNSPVMKASIEAGHIVDIPSLPTLSDGTAGGIEADSITFDLCRQWVDEFLVVNEEEIREALVLLLKKHYLMVEGAAGLSVATLRKYADQYSGKQVVLVLCGRKLGWSHLKDLVHAGTA